MNLEMSYSIRAHNKFRDITRLGKCYSRKGRSECPQNPRNSHNNLRICVLSEEIIWVLLKLSVLFSAMKEF